MKELEKAKEETNQKINEAKEELNNIENLFGIYWDRTDNGGYISFE